MRAFWFLVLSPLALIGCGVAEPSSAPTTSAPAGPDVSTNEAVCAALAKTPRSQSDTRLLWGQVNSGTALDETLAIGWQPGVYDTEADGDLIRAEQFYATLPLAQDVVRQRPGIDDVSVTFTGTNLDLGFKTVFLLPADVVADYEDTPGGRNAVQEAVEVLDELPAFAAPNGLEKVDLNGSLVEQC